MSEVEIVVPERSKSMLKKRLGSLPHVRFVSEPSRSNVARLLMALLEDLEKHRPEFEQWLDHSWGEPASIPVVFLGPGGGKSVKVSLAVLQAMAILSKRVTSRKVDPYVAPCREAAQRLVLAHSRGAEEALIASASLDDETLYVWSCEPRLYRCPVTEIRALAGLTKKQLANFEVSSSGSHLHWPDADVDINLDTIRVHVDPEYRKKAEVAFRQEASLYAEAIKAVREKRGLRQGDIAGLSERQVRRLELGETFPQIKTVEKLASAHGMSVQDYLKELARYSKVASTADSRGNRRQSAR